MNDEEFKPLAKQIANDIADIVCLPLWILGLIGHIACLIVFALIPWQWNAYGWIWVIGVVVSLFFIFRPFRRRRPHG